jgi:hypothetical protein
VVSAPVRRASIHQPGYLPWLGLVDKIARSDVFVALDSVQYSARAFQHRTLYSCVGGPRYLSLSVNSSGHRSEERAIRDVVLVDPQATARHFETLRHRYGRSPGWRGLEQRLGALLLARHERLLDLSLATIRLTLEVLEVPVPIVLASDLGPSATKTDLMIELTRAASAGIYLSGQGARAYLEPEKFPAAGVQLVFQEFHHPTYPQRGLPEFQPGCFALEWALEVGEGAARAFHAHLASHGGPPPPVRPAAGVGA